MSAHAQVLTHSTQAVIVAPDQLGAQAAALYQGDGLSVFATPEGALLRCVFQRLEGLVTSNGLWLASATGDKEKLMVRATALERRSERQALQPHGTVAVADKLVRFVRPGLTEEYSASVNGVRQDFLIERRPVGEGALRLGLEITGAIAQPMGNGLQLVLDGSGRKLAYTRLQVSDAGGTELQARMAVITATQLQIEVDDANAVYPIRIDPTFSDADWVILTGHPGTDNTVSALALDGSGNLYIGGTFIAAGNVVANRIVKWDGTAWSTLGGGFNDSVNVILVNGGTVYAGGLFTTATNTGGATVSVNHVASWNGSYWSALGTGITGASSPSVQALAMVGSDVYVGGTFDSAGGNPASCIAKWNGSTWSAVGQGVDDTVNALAVSGSDVFVAGRFINATNTGGVVVAANRVAKWSSGSWATLGGGVNNGVNTLVFFGGELHAGGNFLLATNTGGGSLFMGNIGRWDGSAWQTLGSGVQSTVAALAVSGGELFVGGSFSSAGGNISLKYVARWDGTNWLPATTGINGNVSALAAGGGAVYAGGAFHPINGSSASDLAKYVARWNTSGSNWVSLSSGLNNSVATVAVWNGELYAGGSFTFSSSPAANFVAKWNGDTWTALGSGVNNYVNALLPTATGLYVGGGFTSAGGTNALRIAKWDGATWSKLGDGMASGSVLALAEFGGELYAGGSFLFADGNTVNRIARWNGTNWFALGTGLSGGDARALAAVNTNLYVGGTFTTANGSAASRIARWDGSNWSTVGTGMGNSVFALAVADTNLYAGGSFTTAGGNTANRIARWNGSTWSALGLGVSSTVSALAASGTNVYAAGSFTLAGGNAASRIAQWNGSSWSALGSGVDNTANALALSGGNLYVGGDFGLAGSKASAYVAKAVVGATLLPGRFTNMVYSPITGFSCTFLDATAGQPYRVQASPALSPASWSDYTNFTYTAPIVITDAAAGTGTNKFFRAVTP